AGLAVVTGRGNGHHVTASHLHQTRRPTQSTAARRARDRDRDWRPASPPVVEPPVSGHRLPKDAIHVIPGRASAAAASSSFRRAPSLDLSFVTRYNVTRYKSEGKGLPISRSAGLGCSRKLQQSRLLAVAGACGGSSASGAFIPDHSVFRSSRRATTSRTGS